MELNGKNIIVTGGVRGIGRNLVERLVNEEKSRVAVLDLDQGGLTAMSADLPSVFGVQCDVTDADQVAASVEKIAEQFGAIDALVNNAGIIYSAPLISIMGGRKLHDVKMWDKVIATNLTSVFLVTGQVVRHMVSKRTRGVIINVSSVSSMGNPGQCAYSAAKAGVEALTATLAKELGVLGIRVACIAPGFTETPSTREALNEEVLEKWIRNVPLRRLARPEEISEGILSLLRNDFFTGKTLRLDGGLVL